MKAVSNRSVFLVSSFLLSIYLLLQSSSITQSVTSAELNGGPLGVEGGCDSCGKECFKVCGLRSFRACCFNYIKKRNGGIPIIHDFDEMDDEESYGHGSSLTSKEKKLHPRNSHFFKNYDLNKRYPSNSLNNRNSQASQDETRELQHQQPPSAAALSSEDLISIISSAPDNRNSDQDKIYVNPYIRYSNSKLRI